MTQILVPERFEPFQVRLACVCPFIDTNKKWVLPLLPIFSLPLQCEHLHIRYDSSYLLLLFQDGFSYFKAFLLQKHTV